MGEDKLSVLEKESLIYAKQMNDDDLRKLIAQARAIVEYRPPKNRPLTPEDNQELANFLGLKPSKKTSESTKKNRKKK